MRSSFAVALFVFASSLQAQSPFDPALDAVMQEKVYAGSVWGLLVVDAESGRDVVAKNGDKLFNPASVTKLFTCAAFLATFGLEHRFATNAYLRTVKAVDGSDRVYLVVRAAGDPNLSGRLDAKGRALWTNSDHIYSGGGNGAELPECDPLSGLADIARQVAAAGVKAVDEVVFDERLFVRAQGSGSGPGVVTPVVVNDNGVDLLVSPAAEAGKPATFELRPRTEQVAVDVQVTTTETGKEGAIRIERLGPNRYAARGTIECGRRPVVKLLAVDDPAAFARGLLVACLREAGVKTSASTLAANDATLLPEIGEYAALPVVARHLSPPLEDLLQVVLKVSHNLHASTLPLVLGAARGARTLEEAMPIEAEVLRSLGVDTTAISFGGGAGGSTADMVTPRATVALLEAMRRRPDFDAYKRALPILGVDGTLAKAVERDSPARGKVFAKTGTMSYDNLLDGSTLLRSKALAGYLTAKSGREFVFALFVNNATMHDGMDSTKAGRALGKICEVLHEHL